MKLTRLRLIGFKSFVEPTDFVIEPGLTGVVGPNGCGKSNLVEAVRWVMGEASYKAMRASEMDDVIFSGNNQRPSRNHAEVAVQVDNSARNAPAAFNDDETLEVSRRIVREQGSTFRVNGREVRARDVAMLFADASTGSRSPALVHQGRIGEIIQARPEQRRRVLEEAAGISGLHARRHEAELRLKAAEQNLPSRRGRDRTIGRPGRGLENAGPAGGALSQHIRAGAPHRGVAVPPALDRGRHRSHGRRARTGRGRPRRCRPRQRTDSSFDTAGRACRRASGAARGRGQGRTPRCKGSSSPAKRSSAKRRAPRNASANSIAGSNNSPPISNASGRWRPTPRRRSSASTAEEATLKAEAQANAMRLSGVNERVEHADAALAASEKSFAELTGALADLTARRNQLQAALHDHRERAEKFAAELVNIEAGLAATGSGAPDLAALTDALAAAQAALAEAESVARAVGRRAHCGARADGCGARPLGHRRTRGAAARNRGEDDQQALGGREQESAGRR